MTQRDHQSPFAPPQMTETVWINHPVYGMVKYIRPIHQQPLTQFTGLSMPSPIHPVPYLPPQYPLPVSTALDAANSTRPTAEIQSQNSHYAIEFPTQPTPTPTSSHQSLDYIGHATVEVSPGHTIVVPEYMIGPCNAPSSTSQASSAQSTRSQPQSQSSQTSTASSRVTIPRRPVGLPTENSTNSRTSSARRAGASLPVTSTALSRASTIPSTQTHPLHRNSVETALVERYRSKEPERLFADNVEELDVLYEKARDDIKWLEERFRRVGRELSDADILDYYDVTWWGHPGQ